MPHNSLVHGGPTDPTAWMPGYVVGQIDYQTIDQTLFECVNGDLGGTWAPADTIVIGGNGLQVVTSASGNFSVIGAAGAIDLYSGNVMVTPAGTQFGGDVDFQANTEFFGQNQFDDIVIFTAASFVTFSGTVAVEAGASFDVACLATFQDDVSVAGDIFYSGTLGGPSATIGSVIVMNATTLSTTSAVASTFNGAVNVNNTMTLTNGALVFSGRW
jgi:hypothetical protein